MTRRTPSLALALLLAFLALPALAAPKLELKVAVSREESVVEEGKTVTRYVPVTVADPGDVLRYEVTYKNIGDAPLAPVVTDPIPEGMSYVGGSATAKPVAPLFSIDGGKSFAAEPLTYVEKDSSGAEVRKSASPEMYTHVRWIMTDLVAPGGAGVFEFKVRVR